jgi:hypothetical protein
MNVKLLKTELDAPGTTGKIQFGAVPGCNAQVIVPAFFGPLADASGTEPIAPGTVTEPGLTVVVVALWLLLQAASAVRLASATATPRILLRCFSLLAWLPLLVRPVVMSVSPFYLEGRR